MTDNSASLSAPRRTASEENSAALSFDDELLAARCYAPSTWLIKAVLDNPAEARSRRIQSRAGSGGGGYSTQTVKTGIEIKRTGRVGVVGWKRLTEIVLAGQTPLLLEHLLSEREEWFAKQRLIAQNIGEGSYEPEHGRTGRLVMRGWCPEAFRAADAHLRAYERSITDAWHAQAATVLAPSIELTLFDLAGAA